MKRFAKVIIVAVVILCALSLSACLGVSDSSSGGNSVGISGNAADNDGGGNVNPANCSHTFGEWQMVKEPSCTLKGARDRFCTKCQTKDTEYLEPVGHTFGEYTVVKAASCEKEGEQYHTCTACSFKETEKIEMAAHNYGSNNICSVCEDRKFGTEELIYELQGKNDPYPGTYQCSSIGTAIMETQIYIASEYNGKPVTYIASDAFSGFEIEKVVIPASIKEIAPSAFTDCTELTSVVFRSGSQLKVLQGFQRCTSLASITVPASVERVAVNAFWGCEALNSMSFELTEGWYINYHNRPDAEPTSVTDTYKNANTFKNQGGQYYYFRMVAPE